LYEVKFNKKLARIRPDLIGTNTGAMIVCLERKIQSKKPALRSPQGEEGS
jgi:hypothetical protein